MAGKSLFDVQQALDACEYNVEQLVKYYLANIDKTKDLNAFVHVFADEAIEKARALDVKAKTGLKKGKLFGAIVSIKDNICIINKGVSAASLMLKGYVSPYSATAINRLLEEDAILIGTTNCDEFGMGSASINSCYGPVKNGLDDRKVAGGSSGGAAVSVQTDCCLFALGSDTGGSIRQPAVLCGVMGFKPSYGTVSRHGLIAYASSFDQIGCIAHDIATIEVVMDVISGQDGYDGTLLAEREEVVIEEGTNKLGLLPAMFPENNAFIQECKSLIYRLADNFEVKEEQFSYMDYLIPCYYILTTAEASSNLSRYDGVRYGYRAEGIGDLNDMYTKSRSEGFWERSKEKDNVGNLCIE